MTVTIQAPAAVLALACAGFALTTSVPALLLVCVLLVAGIATKRIVARRNAKDGAP
jgi:hypothetical protein